MGGLVVWQKDKQEQNNNQNGQVDLDIILFYGQGCPHCAKVDEFLKSNKVEDRIKITKREVYYNKDNANLLVEKASVCGLTTNSIGVPFLWKGSDDSKCLVGDADIINFFQEKLK